VSHTTALQPARWESLPRLLDGFQPLPGALRAELPDFFVEELPLYPASGQGTHTYLLAEKTGVSTLQAVHALASALNVARRDIGFAGMKDARAVTRQWLSIEHVPPETVAQLEIPHLRVLAVARHTNKLRPGHLRGNRFDIKVRQTEPERLGDVRNALGELVLRGVPNYFGPQRFGGRGMTWRIGQAMLQKQPEKALDLLLGSPSPADHGAIRRARKLYDLGKYAEAARLWPGPFRDERRALRVLARTAGDARRAWASVDKRTKLFYLSAYQSFLFNDVLAERMPLGIDRLWAGDLAWLHANGAVFRVVAPAAEQPRADAFEISPTGPLFGYRMSTPSGQAQELEARILGGQQLPPDAFAAGPLRTKGGRRALRFRPESAVVELGADERGAYLELRFTLPPGCYATSLLRELFREPEQPEKVGEMEGSEESFD
jgi:tRNA pseudouridine13 synthase